MRRNNYILLIFNGVIGTSLQKFSIFNSIETQQLHIVYFHRCNWYVSTLIFNSIETQQLHIVYYHRCNWYVSTIIFNFQLSIFNFLEPYSDICYSFQLWFSHRLFYLKMISAIKRETQIVVQ